MKPRSHHSRHAVPPLRSLAFVGDDLVDWLGGHRIDPSGHVTRFGTGHTYRFDDALGHGEVGVLFERLGTKALMVRANGVAASPQFVPLGIDIIRELDRSFYQAGAYAYPLALLTLPDGREAIAHCPRAYNRLDIELLDGELLTPRTIDDIDVFHSRLQVSANGRWLLSNGWVWQPWNVALVYDVARALIEPEHLASEGLPLDLGDDWEWEVEGATVVGDRLVVACCSEQPAIGVLDLDPAGAGPIQIHRLARAPGSVLMPWGDDRVLALEGTPRAISLNTGRIIAEWPALDAGPGLYQPSVTAQPPTPPWVAMDPIGGRFAIAAPSAEDPSGPWRLDRVHLDSDIDLGARVDAGT